MKEPGSGSPGPIDHPHICSDLPAEIWLLRFNASMTKTVVCTSACSIGGYRAGRHDRYHNRCHCQQQDYALQNAASVSFRPHHRLSPFVELRSLTPPY
jgi:hypothetical protein